MRFRDRHDAGAQLADSVVCLHAPAHLAAAGNWYQRFGQTTDDEVRELLDRARRQPAPAAPPAGGPGPER